MPEANLRAERLTALWRQGRNKVVLVVISLVVIIGIVASAGFAWEVYLDGEKVGVVKHKGPIYALISERTSAVQAERGWEVGLASELRFRVAYTFVKDDIAVVTDKLTQGLHFGLKAAVITVNGNEVTAMATAQEAEATLEELKSRFVKTGSNVTLESVRFREDIIIEEKYRKVEDIVDQDAAINVLLYGSEKLLQHTVARGESFWSIATKYQLGVSALQSANPSVKPEVLQIGARLNLKLDEPFARVEVVETQAYAKAIPYSTTYTYDSSLWTWESKVTVPGKNGSQQVTARVVTVNGKEEKRNILTTVITASPTTRVVAKGTKTAPSLSTGAFLWPTTGTITSPYGPRWGSFHSGVDIGAPKGTAIKAADNGIVSFSGWNGGYGYMVQIEHGNGALTRYAHSSKLLVAVNDVVEKGQTIALVGNSGNSYGAHLHFEIHQNGKHVNPLNYFR